MHKFTLGRQIAVLARSWRMELDRRLQPHGLSQARYVLMVHMAEADRPLTQTDLAERAAIAGPTLVRHVDQLEGQGLVTREDLLGDRRVKQVCLTKAGKLAYAIADEIAAGLRTELVEPVDEQQVTIAMGVLRDLANQFDTIRMRGSGNE
jgi:MarR family transcriptional regulator for hemolysin